MRGKKVRTAHSIADGACDYSSIKRRNGIEIVMECADCDSEPALHNPRCFRAVLGAVRSEGMPVAVTMRSHVERRYAQSATATMGRISDFLDRVQNLRSQLARDSSRSQECAGCASQLIAKLDSIQRSMNTMDVSVSVSSAVSMEGLEFGTRRSACADCTGMAKVQMSDIARTARDIERGIVKGAYNIVEAV